MEKIGIIGLGYVGLPLAAAFARHGAVWGYDRNSERIAELERCEDSCDEVSSATLHDLADHLHLSDCINDLAACTVFIIAVPTPVDALKRPDLSPLISASEAVAPLLKQGDVVVYESTVYPGATEEVCVPCLERGSGLCFNRDFFVGYSPERINPGDKERDVTGIVKITSASTPASAQRVDALYRRIITAGTHLAGSIKVAEAAKVIENTQRDVNIALMNELAQIFDRLGIDTLEVLQAAGTKWNFLPFRPGLVGGHCIGVDPYYLVHKAQEVGYQPRVIPASREINDHMSDYLVHRLIANLAERKQSIVGARVLILGLTFKENCPDLRNTRVREIVQLLRRYHAELDLHDPVAEAGAVEREFAARPIETPQAGSYDVVLLCVAHRPYIEWGGATIRGLCRTEGYVFDVKSCLDADWVDDRL